MTVKGAEISESAGTRDDTGKSLAGLALQQARAYPDQAQQRRTTGARLERLPVPVFNFLSVFVPTTPDAHSQHTLTITLGAPRANSMAGPHAHRSVARGRAALERIVEWF
jgi:hypothetical protein